jgi:hypothetical protein
VLKTNYINETVPQFTGGFSNISSVMTTHNVTDIDVINLCGGVPIPDMKETIIKASANSKNAIEVIIECQQFYVSRTIDFYLRRISNDMMDVKEKDVGIGTSLFLNQVKTARSLAFRKLTVWALAHDGTNAWQGYSHWARLGYQMNDAEEIKDFELMMVKLGRTEKTVNELVLSDVGYEIWKQHRESWSGEFILSDGHPCMTHLKKFLNIKGIDVAL